MTLVRLGGQILDDDRSCVACTALAPAEDHQTTLPGKVDELQRQADLLQREVDALRAKAEAVRAEIDNAKPHAYLCGPCKSRLPGELRGPWSPVGAWYLGGLPMGGRLADKPGSPAEADHIAKARAALDANPPAYREPRPTTPRNVHRARHAAMAGVGGTSEQDPEEHPTG